MKMIRCLLVLFVVIWKAQAYAESWGAPQFFYLLAKADTIGIGIDGGSAGAGKSRINNAVFWLGDPGTNHVVLSLRTVGWDIPWDPTNAVGDRVFFWGVRQGWNKDSTNFTFRAMPYSAWELREKLIQAGSAKQTPTPSFEFSGNFIYLTTDSPAMVSFLSNAVHSLCVEPN